MLCLTLDCTESNTCIWTNSPSFSFHCLLMQLIYPTSTDPTALDISILSLYVFSVLRTFPLIAEMKYIYHCRARDSLVKMTKDSFTCCFLRKVHGGVTDAELAFEFSMSESQINNLLNDFLLFVYTNDPWLIEKRSLGNPA